MPDADLGDIQRMQGGDAEAFAALVRRWDPVVHRLAWRLTGSRTDADDLCQMTFARVHQALPAFNGQARFSTWIYRIVVNLCRDHLRARQSYAGALAGLEDGLRRSSAASPGAAANDPAADDPEIAGRIADAVRRLPDSEREPLVLRHYHDMTFAEVAEILSIPVTTVKSRTAAGLRRMRDRLREDGIV